MGDRCLAIEKVPNRNDSRRRVLHLHDDAGFFFSRLHIQITIASALTDTILHQIFDISELNFTCVRRS